MRASPTTRCTWRVLLQLFVAGTVLAAAWIAVLAYGAAQFAPTSRGAFVADYDGRVLDDGLELLIIQSDGQAYATLARDPLLTRAEDSFRTAEEASYRAQRPLHAWAAAIGSTGRSGWVPPALAGVAAIGAGAAAAAAGALLCHRQRSPWLGLVVLALPGMVNSLSFLGAEPLMLGLVLAGVALWERKFDVPAVICFSAAVLARESAILVPATLGLMTLWGGSWKRALPLAAVPAVLVAWYVTLRARLGAWPWEAGEGRLGLPFEGFFQAVPDMWESPALNAGVAVWAALLVIGCLAYARRDHLTSIVVVHAMFATLMGKYVWSEIPGFGRVLLPMYALGLIAIAGSLLREDTPTGELPVEEHPMRVST